MTKRKAPETAKQESKTFQVGRDAKTGRFLSVKEAQRRKKTAVVETISRSREVRGGIALPVKRINGALLMGHEYPAGALV